MLCKVKMRVRAQRGFFFWGGGRKQKTTKEFYSYTNFVKTKIKTSRGGAMTPFSPSPKSERKCALYKLALYVLTLPCPRGITSKFDEQINN